MDDIENAIVDCVAKHGPCTINDFYEMLCKDYFTGYTRSRVADHAYTCVRFGLLSRRVEKVNRRPQYVYDRPEVGE